MTENSCANQAITLIGNYLGHKTAEMYQDFLRDKSSEEVVRTTSDLLEEVLGPTLSAQIISDFKISCNI